MARLLCPQRFNGERAEQAVHPSDPPMPTMCGQPRLVAQSKLYQRLLDLCTSTANAQEYCLGTFSAITKGGDYEATEQYSSHMMNAYVYVGNFAGKLPHNHETW
ncbi:mannonate dehydratase [Bythopirellula polymerisocia]|uniref:Mannonate dehydratase n=1 Tax=Bythopirellula polymerisocia TaxID=2528003 RepID=A0A5C6CUY4_9BACT|nr:mannonate dehydratase [Bythopirellula polymerisocia]TWU28362.1 mannonate dehydratase [Bythopirellula polymerisocia]